jgi:hypothetical protein
VHGYILVVNRIPVIRYFTIRDNNFMRKFTSKKHAVQKIFSLKGEVWVDPAFFEHVAEVRDSSNS